jgi:hypothetical protein
MDIFTSLRNVQNEKPGKSFENPFLKTDLDHNALKMRKIREKSVMRKNIYLNNLKQK